MKKHIAPILDCLFDSLLYLLLSYLLDSAALSFQTSGVFILFFAADFALMVKYLEDRKKQTQNKLLPYLALLLCILAKAAFLYFCGYLRMTLTPFA